MLVVPPDTCSCQHMSQTQTRNLINMDPLNLTHSPNTKTGCEWIDIRMEINGFMSDMGLYEKDLSADHRVSPSGKVSEC